MHSAAYVYVQRAYLRTYIRVHACMHTPYMHPSRDPLLPCTYSYELPQQLATPATPPSAAQGPPATGSASAHSHFPLPGFVPTPADVKTIPAKLKIAASMHLVGRLGEPGPAARVHTDRHTHSRASGHPFHRGDACDRRRGLSKPFPRQLRFLSLSCPLPYCVRHHHALQRGTLDEDIVTDD
ncbi:hypothetical protein J3F83DRAFT_620646 [Trichoderma novae-zelandiae]